jgi:hypothetical protein
MENNYFVIAAVVALMLFLIYKEFRRANRARLVLRLLAVFCAVAALPFLYFPIKYHTSKNKEKGELHLLTAGADVTALKGDVYYTTDSSVLVTSRLRNLSYIPDLAYYLQRHEDVQRISIYGYGVEPEDLKILKNYNSEFHAATMPAGIVSCTWPRELKQTELLQVEGRYHNTTGKKLKIILEGLGTKFDSVTIAANATQLFLLKTQPRQLGRAVYQLTVLSGEDTLQKEQIPFLVNPSPKIKLLVLSSFPDFEYKFLKNWLFEHQYQVVFRTRVSKDKFSTDQLNTPGFSAENINAGLLAKFDGVIADDEELAAMDPAAAAGLRSAINQGLGLLVRMNDVKTLSPPARQFKLYSAADSTAKFFTPVINGQVSKLKQLPAGSDLFVRPDATAQVLVKDQNGKVLVSRELMGNGKITGTVIAATYHWILNGDRADYSAFWSAVISNTIRKEEKSSSWRTIPAFPVKGEETQFVYQSATAALPNISIAGQPLVALKNSTIPTELKSIFWPQQVGWNEIKISGNPVEYLFVSVRNEWKELKQYQTLMENKAYFKKQEAEKENDQLLTEILEKQVSKWWFFALFLLSAAFLWFETKLL